MAARETQMLVYIVQGDGGGPCKIGVTRNLKHRLATLRNASSSDLQVIRTIAGGFETEAWLHDRFADKRITREWFEFSPEMLEIEPPEFQDAPEQSSLPLGTDFADPIPDDWREQFRRALVRGTGGRRQEVQRLTGCDKRVADNYLYGVHTPPMHILLRLMATLPEVAKVIITLTQAAHSQRLARVMDALEVARRELASESPADEPETVVDAARGNQ